MRSVKSKRLIGRVRGFDVFSCSAFEIRGIEEQDEEFGLYATSMDFPSLIESNEIWLAEEGRAEWPVFLEGAVAWATTGSYDAALEAETVARGGLQLSRPITRDWYLRYVKSIPDPQGPVAVWFVDGKTVRDCRKTDFVEGGNPMVYHWIPRNEIWISDAVEEEWPFLIVHEYTEAVLMRDRCMIYNDAHDKANDAERLARSKASSGRLVLATH